MLLSWVLEVQVEYQESLQVKSQYKGKVKIPRDKSSLQRKLNKEGL